MKFIVKLLIKVAAVILLAYVLPMLGIGITVATVLDAVKLAIGLAFLNAFVKPVLKILSFPITCLTMGLFSLVISAAIVKIADYFIAGFSTTGTLNGWLAALIFGLGFSFISSAVESIIIDED
jgi:putative membrane protein